MNSFRVECKPGVPVDIKSFLETRYQSMYVTWSYFKELKQIEKLQTLLLYEDDILCEAFIYEIYSTECVLLNRVTDFEKSRLDFFTRWIFDYHSRVRKVTFRGLMSPYHTRHALCYSASSDLYLKLPATPEEYDTLLGKKSRTRFRGYYSRLKKDFQEIEFRENVKIDELDKDIFEKFVLLKERRFKEKRQANSFDISASQRHQRFAQEYGRITAISISDKLVGGLLCYKVNDKYFAVLVAFDVDYAKYSIGRTVIYLAIKKAIDEKAAEFHFLWGGSDYVTHYGGDTHLLYTTHNFRSNNLFYYICSCRIKIKSLTQRLKHISWVRPLAPYYHRLIYIFQNRF